MTTRIIGQAAKQRRRNQRLQIPNIYLAVEGRLYGTVDWSFGGFQVQGYKGTLRVGDTVLVTHAGMVSDDLTPVAVYARVVRNDGSGHLAAEYEGLSDRAFDVFQAFMMHRRPPPARGHGARA